MMPSRKILELVGAGKKVLHSRTTLFDHLLGTYRILTAWQVPGEVATAGLLHSIYSTQYFKEGIIELSNRDHVRSIAGKNAEQLSFLFSTIDRDWLWSRVKLSRIPPAIAVPDHRGSNTAVLDKRTIQDLALIECANTCEQIGSDFAPSDDWQSWVQNTARLAGTSQVVKHFESFSRIEPEDEVCAWSRYVRITERGSGGPTRGLKRQIENCIRSNPNLAEAYVLLAIQEHSNGKREQSRAAADSAKNLLDSWGCASDNRQTFWQWSRIAVGLRDAPNSLEFQTCEAFVEALNS